MSFSNLRQNAQIYILNKEQIPALQLGTVVSVTAPVPKFNIAGQMPFMQQPQDSVVDVTVRVGETTGTFYKLSSNMDATEYDNGKMIIATTREAMTAEVSAIRQHSLGVINSREMHEKIASACDGILNDLNPEFAEKQKQADEIATLRTQMNELLAMNRQLMAALNGAPDVDKASAANTEKATKKQ